MYAKKNQMQAMSPFAMGHRPTASVAPMMTQQQVQINGNGTNGQDLAEVTIVQTTVMLSDVVDLRSDL